MVASFATAVTEAGPDWSFRSNCVASEAMGDLPHAGWASAVAELPTTAVDPAPQSDVAAGQGATDHPTWSAVAVAFDSDSVGVLVPVVVPQDFGQQHGPPESAGSSDAGCRHQSPE